MNKIILASHEDKEEVLALYKSMWGGPAGWDEHYPSEETVDFDLSRDSLIVMKNDAGEIIASISIDDDEEVKALSCWSGDIAPASEISRLVVREDMWNRGIARRMILFSIDILRERGDRGIHFLVRREHKRAIASYTPLGFKTVGQCNLFNKDYICMEMGI